MTVTVMTGRALGFLASGLARGRLTAEFEPDALLDSLGARLTTLGAFS